jgi:sugar/nucleoside kinase (ribokinase family)
MSPYHVYGIGNALVDMEYEITPEDLEALRIDKGVMTLVDEDHQREIMTRLADHPHQRGSGGSAANTVIAVSQLGGRGFYSCKVAEDDLGRFYLDDLVANGVDTNRHGLLDQGHTGRCVVLVTPDADRTLVTHLGITGGLSTRELVPEAIQAADYLYIEGYLCTSDSARAAACEAKRIAEAAGVKTALSLSDPNMVTHFRDGLLEMIGDGVDFLFANEAEAQGMAQGAGSTDPLDYLKTIAGEFAMTRGPQGALIYDGEAVLEIAPNRVEAIDTVGAGDMFAGAFLYGITQGWSHQRAGELASAASARLVTSLGPRISREAAQEVLGALA